MEEFVGIKGYVLNHIKMELQIAKGYKLSSHMVDLKLDWLQLYPSSPQLKT